MTEKAIKKYQMEYTVAESVVRHSNSQTCGKREGKGGAQALPP